MRLEHMPNVSTQAENIEESDENKEKLEKFVRFMDAADGVTHDGLTVHKENNDEGGASEKVYHTSEHPLILLKRAEKMAQILDLAIEEGELARIAIAYHDAVIGFDKPPEDKVTAMIRRHRGACEGDNFQQGSTSPHGAEGNEAQSALLAKNAMEEINIAAGEGNEVFTEEQIKIVVSAIEATYPEVDFGQDFTGKKFSEYSHYGIAMENPELKKVFDELEGGGIDKGPLFFQPHLEKVLENHEQVPLEVVIVALADLGGAGVDSPDEFFKEGNDEMRELYHNLRDTEVMSRLASGNEEKDKTDREDVMKEWKKWLDLQPRFAAFQSLRFEKIIHLLREQPKPITEDQEEELREQFSNYGKNIRATLNRSKQLKEKSEGMEEKAAFLYLAKEMGYDLK